MEPIVAKKIFVTVQVPGLHFWPEGLKRSENHKYLFNAHRHIFHIKVTKIVFHNNRDIEYLELKDQLLSVLLDEWPYITNTFIHDFGNRSCEMLAERLLYRLNANEVEVSEDGENGSIITKELELK